MSTPAMNQALPVTTPLAVRRINVVEERRSPGGIQNPEEQQTRKGDEGFAGVRGLPMASSPLGQPRHARHHTSRHYTFGGSKQQIQLGGATPQPPSYEDTLRRLQQSHGGSPGQSSAANMSGRAKAWESGKQQEGMFTPHRGIRVPVLDHTPSSQQMILTVPGNFYEKLTELRTQREKVIKIPGQQITSKFKIPPILEIMEEVYSQVLSRNYERSVVPCPTNTLTVIVEDQLGEDINGKDHTIKLCITLVKVIALCKMLFDASQAATNMLTPSTSSRLLTHSEQDTIKSFQKICDEFKAFFAKHGVVMTNTLDLLKRDEKIRKVAEFYSANAQILGVSDRLFTLCLPNPIEMQRIIVVFYGDQAIPTELLAKTTPNKRKVIGGHAACQVISTAPPAKAISGHAEYNPEGVGAARALFEPQLWTT